MNPQGEIHVWRAELDLHGWPSPERLPGEERERVARLRRPQSARRWVAARWALRGVLGHYLDEDPAEVALRIDDRGKPELEPATRLHFNLSHSADLALVAVTREAEVGVDVEWIDPRRDVLALAPTALDRDAARAVREAPVHLRSAAFHALWVRREAIAKCLGGGLGAPAPDLPVATSELDAGSGFAAAIAVAGYEVPPLRRLAITQRLEVSAPSGAASPTR